MIELVLEDVGVQYGRAQVLDAVTTPPVVGREVVAIIGPNAAGKSTLLRRIAGLVGGTGTVRASGASNVPGREALRTTYLPQETSSLAALTVYESILLALRQRGSWTVGREETQLIELALRTLRIEDLAMRRLSELSGGQRQLASLAQTLARQPDIMLLDEPTSALDLRRQYEVVSVIRETAAERGIVAIVSIHDLDLALRFADKVLVLSQGRCVAFGTSSDVITPELLASVYQVRARIEGLGGQQPHVVVEGPI